MGSVENIPWSLIGFVVLVTLLALGAFYWDWSSKKGQRTRHPDDDEGPRTVGWLVAHVADNPRPTLPELSPERTQRFEPIPNLGATMRIHRDELTLWEESLRVPPYVLRHLDRAPELAGVGQRRYAMAE